MHRQPGKQDPLPGLQWDAHGLQRRRDALGAEGEPLHTKYMYVCHAELNAILNSAHNNLKGARVYVTLFPCNECTKAIIQSGIAEVVYYGDKYHDSDSSVAARFMFKKAGVRLTAYTPSGRKELLEL